MTQLLGIEEQLGQLSKNERIDFLRQKLKHYQTPQGCIDYIQECVYIPMIGKGLQPFKLFPRQIELVESVVDFLFSKSTDMYSLLGSRQCGKTTILTAVATWLTTFFGSYPIVVVHVDDKRGARVCGDFRTMCNNRPKFMQMKRVKNALTHQIFTNGSSIMLQPTQKTSKAADTGRSITSAMLWIDEAAFIDLEKLEEGLFPTTSQSFQACALSGIPYGIILTTTPNGRVGIGRKFYMYWSHVMNKDTMFPGFRLYWKDIPIYDDAWYEKQKAKLDYNTRKINQEYELVFYGAEASFFTDADVEKIQQRAEVIKQKTATPVSFVLKEAVYVVDEYDEIIPGHKYLMGIDPSKALGKDNATIEVIDYDSGTQVLEFAHNRCEHGNFVELVDKLVSYIFGQGGTCVLCIEENLGYAIRSDLMRLRPSLYRLIIYRDTISADNAKTKTARDITYDQCSYGINLSGVSRPLLIDQVYKVSTRSLELVQSPDLIMEIESLEQKDDGRVEGVPHDDRIFGIGIAWLVRSKGRANVLRDLLSSAEDFIPSMKLEFQDPDHAEEIRSEEQDEMAKTLIMSDSPRALVPTDDLVLSEMHDAVASLVTMGPMVSIMPNAFTSSSFADPNTLDRLQEITTTMARSRQLVSQLTASKRSTKSINTNKPAEHISSLTYTGDEGSLGDDGRSDWCSEII